MKTVLKNFRVIDEETDAAGHVIIEDGFISRVITNDIQFALKEAEDAALVIDGKFIAGESDEMPVLMPAFVDLHAHFRDSGASGREVPFPAETLESASMSAAAGGFGTAVCMANTKPPIDSAEKAAAVRRRSGFLGLVDLYPVVSLTKGMEGRELAALGEIPRVSEAGERGLFVPLMLSEDGRDIAGDGLFIAAMKEAGRIGIPVSCHCDFGGAEAEALKKSGEGRGIWSRVEENNAVRRVIELGKKAGCHIHIAHVSTKEAVEIIRMAKAENAARYSPSALLEFPFVAQSGQFRPSQNESRFILTCEATPHNICLTEKDARRLGEETYGRVNPPLRREDDRRAVIEAILDGTIDAIATDHAPHGEKDKENGAPGFSGFETAFAAVYTELVKGGISPYQNTGDDSEHPWQNKLIDLKRLSSLMSANPARLLGLGGGADFPEPRGRVLAGYAADLALVDLGASRIVNPETFKTRGKNSPFTGRRLCGKIILTLHRGRVVFS